MQEIKSLLHESIENIDDTEVLLIVKQILDRKCTSTSNPPLADWQIERIEESKEQLMDGKFISNSKADLLVERWLNE